MQSSLAGERFAVVVVNYNGGEALLEAVRSALNAGVPPAQIVVVDNGSHDDSLAELSQSAPDTLILRNGCNAGFARAVNCGLKAIPAEFYLLLNNDAQLQSGALGAFAEAFDATPKLAIAGGQLRYPNGRLQSAFAPLPTLVEELIPLNFLKWFEPARYVRSSASLETREVESVFGACLAVRSAVLPQVGLLDEDFFFYFEEVEWCRRARLAGFIVQYVPSGQATTSSASPPIASAALPASSCNARSFFTSASARPPPTTESSRLSWSFERSSTRSPEVSPASSPSASLLSSAKTPSPTGASSPGTSPVASLKRLPRQVPA